MKGTIEQGRIRILLMLLGLFLVFAAVPVYGAAEDAGKDAGAASAEVEDDGEDAAPVLKIGAKKKVLYTGESYKFPIEMKGRSSKLKWTLSKSGIVKLKKSKRKVYAKNPGKVTVTVSANGLKRKCRITVKETSLKLNKKTLTLYPDSKKSRRKLKAKVVGRSKKVTWTSSNPKYATVDENGVITVLKTGKTVKITAKANKLKAVCKVKLKDRPLIALDKSKLTIKARTKRKLILTIQGIDETPVWTSSNPEVATVTQKGKISALKAGKTTIKVTAGKYSARCKIKVKKNPVVKSVELFTDVTDDTEFNTVVGFDAEGSEVWSYDAEGGPAGEHRYVQIESTADYVHVVGMTWYLRLDKNSGKVLNRTKIKMDGTPIIYMDAEESVYAIGGTGEILYKFGKNGELLWKTKLDDDFMFPGAIREIQTGVLKVSDDSGYRFAYVLIDADDGDPMEYVRIG